MFKAVWEAALGGHVGGHESLNWEAELGGCVRGSVGGHGRPCSLRLCERLSERPCERLCERPCERPN